MVFPLMQEQKISAFTLDIEFHQHEALGSTAHLVALRCLFQLSPGTNWTTPVSITRKDVQRAREGFPRHHLLSRGTTRNHQSKASDVRMRDSGHPSRWDASARQTPAWQRILEEYFHANNVPSASLIRYWPSH